MNFKLTILLLCAFLVVSLGFPTGESLPNDEEDTISESMLKPGEEENIHQLAPNTEEAEINPKTGEETIHSETMHTEGSKTEEEHESNSVDSKTEEVETNPKTGEETNHSETIHTEGSKTDEEHESNSIETYPQLVPKTEEVETNPKTGEETNHSETMHTEGSKTDEEHESNSVETYPQLVPKTEEVETNPTTGEESNHSETINNEGSETQEESKPTEEEGSESEGEGSESEGEGSESEGEGSESEEEGSESEEEEESKPSNEEYTENVEKSAKNLFGVQCMVGAVAHVKDGSKDFEYEIKKCAEEIPNDVNNVIYDSQDLTRISADVTKINDEICDNASYNDEDGDKATSVECANAIQRKMGKLRSTIDFTKKDIESCNLKKTCFAIAIENFEINLENTDERISKCATLSEKV